MKVKKEEIISPTARANCVPLRDARPSSLKVGTPYSASPSLHSQ